MDFIEFKEKLFNVLNDKLDEDLRITEKNIMKNNGKLLSSITIQNNEDTIFPTFYYEDLYECLGENISVEDIADHILEMYYSSRKYETPDMEFMTDYSIMSERVLPKLIHTKKNEEYLSCVPHIPFLDLSVVFYCLMFDDNIGNASITVTNEAFAAWNITTAQLFEDAKKNLKRLLHPSIRPIHEVLLSTLKEQGKDVSEVEEMFENEMKPSMYVMTNSFNTYGAASMLDVESLEKLTGKLDCDLFILPSSIHEVILVKVMDDYGVKELEEMVANVNETEVPMDAVLSNHVYLYRRKSNRIEIAS